VFGKVRYMSAEGLERKARPEEYDEKVGALDRRGPGKGALIFGPSARQRFSLSALE
jgi:hypothetical protein